MQQPSRPTELASAVNISLSYASEILSGERKPSRRLAIRIFRKTGWKPTTIAALSDSDISLLERIEGGAA